METLQDVAGFFRQFWGLWLMIFFMGIVAYAYWPRNRARFDSNAMIPLRDDEDKEWTNGGRP